MLKTSSRMLQELCSIIDELSKLPIMDDPNLLATEALKKPRHWSNREDSRLLAGVLIWGSSDWQQISNFTGAGRNRSQCLQRWTRTLNPAIKKDGWTEEEDKRLIELVEGSNKISWTRIARKLSNRSDVQCRYHYSQLKKAKSIIIPHQQILFSRKKIDIPKNEKKISKHTQIYAYSNSGQIIESPADDLMCVDSFLSCFRRE